MDQTRTPEEIEADRDELAVRLAEEIREVAEETAGRIWRRFWRWILSDQTPPQTTIGSVWHGVLRPTLGQWVSRMLVLVLFAQGADTMGIPVPMYSTLIDWIEADTALRRAAAE